MASIRFRRRPRFEVRRITEEVSGQSTVEHALLVVVFLAMVLAVGALWKLGAQGTLARLAAEAASHIVGAADGLRDILLF